MLRLKRLPSTFSTVNFSAVFTRDNVERRELAATLRIIQRAALPRLQAADTAPKSELSSRAYFCSFFGMVFNFLDLILRTPAIFSHDLSHCNLLNPPEEFERSLVNAERIVRVAEHIMGDNPRMKTVPMVIVCVVWSMCAGKL